MKLNKVIANDGTILIKEMEYKDVMKMKNWGNHENTLFEGYNVSSLSKIELKYWYMDKVLGFKKKYFSIYFDGEMVGYIGLKGIKYFFREATLGFALNPDYLNKGIGSKSLLIFLNYYFKVLKMKTLKLEVNEFNKRAKRVYEKVGFKEEGEFLGEFEVQKIYEDPYYIANRDCFVEAKGKIYSRIIIMKISFFDYDGLDKKNENKKIKI